MIHVFLKQQSSTDLHADVHNSGKLNASAKFLIIERASRYPPVPLIRNSIFAQNDPFSHLGSHIIPVYYSVAGPLAMIQYMEDQFAWVHGDFFHPPTHYDTSVHVRCTCVCALLSHCYGLYSTAQR